MIALRTLRPGTTFRVAGLPQLRGRLERLTPGAATVTWSADAVPTTRTFRRYNPDTEAYEAVTITTAPRRETIAPGTLIEEE